MSQATSRGDYPPENPYPSRPRAETVTFSPSVWETLIFEELSYNQPVEISQYLRKAKSILIRNPHGVVDAENWVLRVSNRADRITTDGYPLGPGDTLSMCGPFPIDFHLYIVMATDDSPATCNLLVERETVGRGEQ